MSCIRGSQDVVVTSEDGSILSEGQPGTHVNLSGLFSRDAWSWNVAVSYYGEYTVEEGGPTRQEFDGKFLVDTQFRYSFDNGLSVNVGGNNIFDETPDINTIGQSRAGTIVDGNGDVIVQSNGVFQYSRRSAPFGFNGAYFYAGADYRF